MRFGLGAGVTSMALCALACGSSPAAEAPKAPQPLPAGAPSAGGGSVTTPNASATPALAPPLAEPVPTDRQRPLQDTALLAELEKTGLKAGALPKLEELSARQRLPVMEAFTKALGVKCTGCHVSDKDLKADTPNKQLTRHMWNDFVVPLRQNDKPLFCDSCHQGSAKILHRTDQAAVRAFMKSELVGKLKTTSGTISCETCHGAPFEPHVFEKRWGIKAMGG